jgi:RNA polymerase sigma-70 factor (sigma-E family)
MEAVRPGLAARSIETRSPPGNRSILPRLLNLPRTAAHLLGGYPRRERRLRPEQEQDYVEYVKARLPRFHRVAYLLCGDGDRADDAVQTALTTLYVRWRRMHHVANLDAYVHTMVVRACLSELRRPWSRVLLRDQVPDIGVDDPQVEQRLLVRAALRRLPEGQRSVLVLRFLCDMSVAEVAEVLGRAEGTVKSQTSHGLHALRAMLEQWRPDLLQPRSTR